MHRCALHCFLVTVNLESKRLIFYLTLLFTTYLLFQVLQSQRPSHQCIYSWNGWLQQGFGGLFDIRTSASFCRHMDQYVSKVSCPCWRPVGHQHLSFCTCCFQDEYVCKVTFPCWRSVQHQHVSLCLLLFLFYNISTSVSVCCPQDEFHVYYDFFVTRVYYNDG